jgi:hypothetical protein
MRRRHSPRFFLVSSPFGIEKRLARYPQFYSRIGFVHEFRTLSSDHVRELLARRWRPWGVGWRLRRDGSTKVPGS